ncbi:hypothetical protein R6Q59_031302 [Mikania micrantha]
MCVYDVCWVDWRRQLQVPETSAETTEKIVQIRNRWQRLGIDRRVMRQTSLKVEFQVGDEFLLKVSPWKGVIRFGKRGKLSPRYVGPFEILKRIGPVAYQLKLPDEISGVHDVFHVSNLKKCLSDETLIVPLEEIQVDEQYDSLKNQLKSGPRGQTTEAKQDSDSQSSWNSRRGPEFTWEREDQ